MRDQLLIHPLSRGVYALASMSDLEEPDLVAVAMRIPKGVICLISALVFHELTTQIPHAVDIAIERGSERPRVSYPPVNVYWFSDEAFSAGIEEHTFNGKTVRVYCAEKSVADAFKFRNRIGVDIALESLKAWRSRSRPNLNRLMHFAQICRVSRIIRPYLEAAGW